MSVKEHYDNHLGNFYDWMIGDFDSVQKQQQSFFERNNIKANEGDIAIDLGAGSGLQSISLANLGFKTIAVDFNKQLLEIFENRMGKLNIKIILDDISGYMKDAPHSDVITCMGDTISHLGSLEELGSLIKCCADSLNDKGLLILSYRDYGIELKGSRRFIPVRSDDSRILTCFLEFREDTVNVTDLLYERTETGWQQKVSSYLKLRLTKLSLDKIVSSAGLKKINEEEMNRMIYVIFEKS